MSKKKNRIEGVNIFQNNKKFVPSEIEDFIDIDVADVDLKIADLQKNMLTISLSEINIENSRKFQGRIVSNDFTSLLESVNTNGINDPLKGVLDITTNEYLLLDGFTRYKVYNILSSEEKLKKYKIVPSRQFNMSDKVSIIVYTNKDGSPLNETQIKSLATLFNNQRKNWSMLDVVKQFVVELKSIIADKVAKIIEDEPEKEEKIKTALSSPFPRTILFYLEKLNVFDKEDIGYIKNLAIKKLQQLTGKSKKDISRYSKLVEIPEEFWGVFTNKNNKWGLELTEKQVLDSFFNKKGFCKKKEDIMLLLEDIQAKENKSGRGMAKVTNQSVKESAKKLEENDGEKEEIVKPKKISKKEKKQAKLMLDLVKREDRKAQNKTITFIDFVDILNDWDNLRSIDEFKTLIKKKFDVELPEIETT